MNQQPRIRKENLILPDEVYNLVGAAMEVHTQLGCGFLESVYQEALEWELKSRDIPFESQKILSIRYKDVQLAKTFVADLVAYDQIIVELKATSELSSQAEAQVINYLKASNLSLGLLLNFGASSLQWKRLVK